MEQEPAQANDWDGAKPDMEAHQEELAKKGEEEAAEEAGHEQDIKNWEGMKEDEEKKLEQTPEVDETTAGM